MNNFLRNLELVRPHSAGMPEYVAALERGFNPNPMLGEKGLQLALALAQYQPDEYLRQAHDPEGLGPPIPCPDGSTVPRLPSIQRWIWSNQFLGTIGFRWVPGQTELPPTCLGHIGYAVVPWAQNKGVATRALSLMLVEAKAMKMPFVTLCTREDFLASQRVIRKNGGTEIERFISPPELGAEPGIRFRIPL
ncbi:MAG: GNAT family N-acetyltransferase [Burkholderiaceae bacterium]